VIPKARALLPTDVPAATLDEMGRVGKIVSDAFSKVAKAKPSELFVNPPQLVTIAQLHLHVIPPMRPLREGVEDAFWSKVSTALGKTLGPSA
jgi:diadenosine tetraphosphate (Ap4A) HIT family hydrolase